jgi:hypothetical protein
MPVERTLMAPPRSRIGAVTPDERAAVRRQSPVGSKYDTAVNRESAYEMLNRRSGATGATGARGAETSGVEQSGSAVNDFLWGTKRRQGMVETMAKQAARTVGSQLGRQILRGVLGGILGGPRGR